MLFLLQDFDSWFNTNNCIGDSALVERLHEVSMVKVFTYSLHVYVHSFSVHKHQLMIFIAFVTLSACLKGKCMEYLQCVDFYMQIYFLESRY